MFIIKELYRLESLEKSRELLTETEKRMVDNEGVVFLAGKLQEADKANGNNRIYPRHILEREIQNYQKVIGENRALGEMDHPEHQVIELKNASHVVTEARWEGDSVVGKIRLLDTVQGKNAQAIARAGIPLSISSRGLGTVNENNGVSTVADDFSLICFDIVSEGSVAGSFMQLQECKNYNRNQLFTKADRINRALNDFLR